MYQLCMIVCSDLSPSSSLCLYMSEYLALLRRRIDFNSKTQIRPNMLQSLAPLVRSSSQRDAYNQALKRSLINYSMTRRNKCCVFFDGWSLYNALLLHWDGGQRILLSPMLDSLSAKINHWGIWPCEYRTAATLTRSPNAGIFFYTEGS